MDTTRSAEPSTTGGCGCGAGFEKHFCGGCGPALFSRSSEDPEIVSPRLGSFDGDPGVRPSSRQFVDYAAP